MSIDADKARAWLAKGAQPSDTVARLLRLAGVTEAAPVPAAAATTTGRGRARATTNS